MFHSSFQWVWFVLFWILLGMLLSLRDVCEGGLNPKKVAMSFACDRSARDNTALLARMAEALYPHLTSSAILENSAVPHGDSISSSLHLPKIESVGSSSSEEVSEHAGHKPAA
jgi:hypothetical protein